MSTPRDIITAAHGFSTKNRPGQIATIETELLGVVTRAFRGLWAFAARINPEFFGKQAAVVPAANVWTRPADAELIWLIENPLGQEVAVVRRTDILAESGLPSVTFFGQRYRVTGAAPGPVGTDTLTFFYSMIAPAPATVDTAFDALWPTHFDDLLVRETALYLALKDGRDEELAGLRADRDQWAQLFAAFLEHETANVRVRYGTIRTFNVQTLISAHLAGGAP